jgi:hypothetical protein
MIVAGFYDVNDFWLLLKTTATMMLQRTMLWTARFTARESRCRRL